MKKLTMFFGFLMISALTIAGPGTKKDEKKRGEKMREELNLTDDQVVKMKAIREKKMAAHKEARQKVEEAREIFDTTSANPKVSEDELKKKFQELQDAQTSSHRIGFETMIEIRAILNETQRSKYHQMRKEMRKKFVDRRKESIGNDSDPATLGE